jgi:hypothetical protein
MAKRCQIPWNLVTWRTGKNRILERTITIAHTNPEAEMRSPMLVLQQPMPLLVCWFHSGEGDRHTTSTTKLYNHSPKTTPLKLSNKHRNRLNQKLETAGRG